MADIPSTLQVDRAALDLACVHLELRMVVLFGSHATGQPAPGPASDVDLAVAFHPGRERAGWWDTHKALSDVFPGAELDLAFLADADPLFRWEIMREGKLLWGDPLDHLEYRAFAYRDFVDSADLRSLERHLFERKMALVRERLRAAS